MGQGKRGAVYSKMLMSNLSECYKNFTGILWSPSMSLSLILAMTEWWPPLGREFDATSLWSWTQMCPSTVFSISHTWMKSSGQLPSTFLKESQCKIKIFHRVVYKGESSIHLYRLFFISALASTFCFPLS